MALAGNIRICLPLWAGTPHEADSFDAQCPALLREWSKRDRVVAIGEIGLDYHYDFAPRETQKRVFESQLALGRRSVSP